MSENFNKDYADYYNLLYQDKNYDLEVNYIDSLLKTQSSSSVSSLLNLGCGTGSHDFLFAQKGYDITGVDLSETMVDIANGKNKKFNRNLNFIQGDVRTIRIKKKFDAVMALFHVMSYQNSNEDVLKTFETAKIHLKEKGLFVFDCWNGPAVLNEKPSVKIKRIADENMNLIRIAEPVVHPETNIVDVNYEMILYSSGKPVGQNKGKPNAGRSVFNKINEKHSMRYFFHPEIEFFANQAGFKILACYEWLTLSTNTGKSWSVIYILR